MLNDLASNMSVLNVTLTYGSILIIIYALLSANVIRQRVKTQTLLGEGGNDDMLRAIRAHGNFMEYVPITLILMALIEISGGDETWLRVIGGVTVLARIIHAAAMTNTGFERIGRPLATLPTLLILLGLGIWGLMIVL